MLRRVLSPCTGAWRGYTAVGLEGGEPEIFDRLHRGIEQLINGFATLVRLETWEQCQEFRVLTNESVVEVVVGQGALAFWES